MTVQDWPEKYMSICSDNQVALKALQAAKTRSPLVRQCQQVLNDISAQHAVRLYWVPGHAGVRGNEIADGLARSGSGQWFIGPEPCFGVSRQNIRRWNAGWGISIWHCGEVPVVHRGRLRNWSLALIWPQGPNCCPLIGHKPGLLLACLPDITHWEDIYMWWGSMITPPVGSVAPRGNLGAHFMRVWGFSLTQACTSAFLFPGPGGY